MLVVNLTTTSGRLDLCAVTLWSLIHQELLPDRIDLYISHDAYMADNGIDNLPEWYEKLNNIKKIINIKYVENTGPYRKIFPALAECAQDDILVYADDDVVYARCWLKTLVSTFNRFNGEAVVAARVRIKNKNLFGRYQSYNRYAVSLSEREMSNDFIITGVGGCVLKKEHVLESFISNHEFINIAPRTDDLWISKLLELSGSKVVTCPKALVHVMEIQHSNDALSQTNNIIFKTKGFSKFIVKVKNLIFGYFGVSLSNNDQIMRKIDSYFSMERKID
ncbi:TPA: glycosyltransferase [Serratia marcescens]